MQTMEKDCIIAKKNYIMGLSFISSRQRQKEGTFSASELAGIEPTPPARFYQTAKKFTLMQNKFFIDAKKVFDKSFTTSKIVKKGHVK
jgi:hypothetical protein